MRGRLDSDEFLTYNILVKDKGKLAVRKFLERTGIEYEHWPNANNLMATADQDRIDDLIEEFKGKISVYPEYDSESYFNYISDMTDTRISDAMKVEMDASRVLGVKLNNPDKPKKYFLNVKNIGVTVEEERLDSMKAVFDLHKIKYSSLKGKSNGFKLDVIPIRLINTIASKPYVRCVFPLNKNEGHELPNYITDRLIIKD